MKIAIIGVGAMGGAIAKGLVKSGVLPSDITVSAPHQSTLNQYERLGISVTTDNRVAARKADVIMIAVKPWLVETVVGEIKPELDFDRQAIVCVAAGIKGEQLAEWLKGKAMKSAEIMLCIPNIAIEELSSMTFLANVSASDETMKTISDLFAKMGEAKIVAEKQLSAGCTIASCGIAYALRYIRAAVEGSVELGFKAGEAQQIVAQTLAGTVKLLQSSGKHPEELIDAVTTPGGLTIKGLNAMERNGFSNAVIEGLKAGI
jgi:pyrroline-5-carboxylate reductase